jgi:hypothetical protein
MHFTISKTIEFPRCARLVLTRSKILLLNEPGKYEIRC